MVLFVIIKTYSFLKKGGIRFMLHFPVISRKRKHFPLLKIKAVEKEEIKKKLKKSLSTNIFSKKGKDNMLINTRIGPLISTKKRNRFSLKEWIMAWVIPPRKQLGGAERSLGRTLSKH